MREAAKRDLFIVTHAGYDVAFRDHVHCTPDMILHVLEELRGLIEDKLILAHLGGYDMPDEVLQKLIGKPVWMDTVSRQVPGDHSPPPRCREDPVCQRFAVGQPERICQDPQKLCAWGGSGAQDILSKCQTNPNSLGQLAKHMKKSQKNQENFQKGLTIGDFAAII